MVRPSRINMEDLEKSINYCLENYSLLHFWAHDQDILNFIFSSNATRIDSSYNQDMWKNFGSTPKLLHFSGFFKPWKMSQGAIVFFTLFSLSIDIWNFRKERMRFYRATSVIRYLKEMNQVARFQRSREFRENGEEIEWKSKSITVVSILRHLASRVSERMYK